MYRCAARIFLGLSVLAISLGCMAPVYNVTNRPIVPSGGKPKTLNEVKAAILEAGRARRWTMREVEPGHLEATVRPGGLAAIVDIRYSTTSYSISYKRSEGVEYDGTKIYSRYNTWIENLQQEIDKRL